MRAEEQAFLKADREKKADQTFRNTILVCVLVSTASLALIALMLATVFVKLRLYEGWKP